MNMARVCCCEPALTACCTFWACPENANPITNITIDYITTVYRFYDTSEIIALSEFTWTVQSVGTFTRKGTNCTTGLWDGCPQATVTWSLILKEPAREGVGTGSTLDGSTETANPAVCAGCIYPGPSCTSYSPLCVGREQHFYGSQTVTGTVDAMRYECHTGCDKCVRPMVSYTPPTTLLTGLFTQTEPCLCGPNQPDIGPEASTIQFNGFSIGGACGCPDSDTWLQPISIVTGFGAGTCLSQNLPYNGCILACDCEQIESLLHTIGTGSDVFTWQCEDYYPDPANPSIVQCSRTITYIDKCVQYISVTVT